MKQKESLESFRFEELSFGHEGQSAVFEGVSFEMPKSRAIWVRSPGGRGKSTLLKLMAGLLTAQKGKYLINGQDINEMSFEEFLKFRLNMGYGFDLYGLLNNKTIEENLLLPLEYHKILTPEEAKLRIGEVIELFGIHDCHKQRPFAVTGSQRKLTCVLRALVHWPEVVFLDDPTNGLKNDNLADLYHYLDRGFADRGLKQIFFASENAEFAKHFSAEELLISYDWFTARPAA